MTNQGHYKIITSQEQYDLAWEKAKKYDRLVRALDKIRAEIIKMRRNQNCSCADCLDIIDKYRAESEERDEQTTNR